MQKRGKGSRYDSSGGRWVGESSPLTYETYILMNTINTKKTPSAKYFQEKTVWKRLVLILLYSD